MTPRRLAATFLLAACAGAAAGCSHPMPTAYWPPITDPLVFGDAFGSHVEYHAFAGSKYTALAIDSTEAHSGVASLRFTVPNPGDPAGAYAGGAFVTTQSRSLVPYNALSFWVKASRAASLETAGFGNNNAGTSIHVAWRNAIPMTTGWTRVLVPIPLRARLEDEPGLFFVAEGPQNGAGLTFWIDDVQFVRDYTITNPRPALTSQTLNAFAGATLGLSNATRTVFTVSGLDQTVMHMPAYFDYASSAPSVATVIDGVVHVLGPGTAVITARLDTVDATGSITVKAGSQPATAAPTPTVPAASVISLFSNAYPNVPVDTWSAAWDQADVSDMLIAGNPTKVYTSLVYAGIEFASHPIDAAAMTHFHMDVWVPGGTTFRVKLVDFGADGVYGGGNDTQSELTFDATTTPALVTGAWVGLEVPLDSFTGLASRSHLAQLVLSGDTRTAFVDNLYLHR